jgi:hypothetical protein
VALVSMLPAANETLLMVPLAKACQLGGRRRETEETRPVKFRQPTPAAAVRLGVHQMARMLPPAISSLPVVVEREGPRLLRQAQRHEEAGHEEAGHEEAGHGAGHRLAHA